MDPVEKLKPNTGKPVDQLEYSRAIGCLMYAMTSTRPDIAYVVGRLSTMNYGLSYVGYPSVLEAYSDASWINHVEDSSSTSGWVFLLGGGAISWASKKQTCITGSTMESEFVALAAAARDWNTCIYPEGMTKRNHLCEHEVLPLQEAWTWLPICSLMDWDTWLVKCQVNELWSVVETNAGNTLMEQSTAPAVSKPGSDVP
ncbi:hypothetical protein Tco_1160886 [Tanacetum coccineum]